MNNCVDCNKQIHKKSIRCKSCAAKERNKSIRVYFYCKTCDKKISYGHEYCKKHYGILISKIHLGKKLSEDHKSKIGLKATGRIGYWKNKKRLDLSGENNPNWHGGTENKPYSFEFNETLKEIIRKRDNYICQNPECNMTEEEHIIVYGKVLTIHHIDYNKENCVESNLITTCMQCNSRANFNRDYWKKIYNEKILTKNGGIPNGKRI